MANTIGILHLITDINITFLCIGIIICSKYKFIIIITFNNVRQVGKYTRV